MDFEVLLWFIFIPLKIVNFHIKPLFSVDLKWDRIKRHKTKYWLTIILKMLSHFPFLVLVLALHFTHLKCVSERFEEDLLRAAEKKGKWGNGSNVKWIIFWREFMLGLKKNFFTITMTLIVAWKSVRIRVKKRHHHAC